MISVGAFVLVIRNLTLFPGAPKRYSKSLSCLEHIEPMKQAVSVNFCLFSSAITCGGFSGFSSDCGDKIAKGT